MNPFAPVISIGPSVKGRAPTHHTRAHTPESFHPWLILLAAHDDLFPATKQGEHPQSRAAFGPLHQRRRDAPAIQCHAPREYPPRDFESDRSKELGAPQPSLRKPYWDERSPEFDLRLKRHERPPQQ